MHVLCGASLKLMRGAYWYRGTYWNESANSNKLDGGAY